MLRSPWNPEAQAGTRYHPEVATLARYVTAESSPGSAFLIARHCAVCASCRERLALLGWSGASAPAPAVDAWRPLRRGVRYASLQEVAGLGEAVLALEAEAGAHFLADGEFAVAELLVTSGSLACDGRRLQPGDFIAVQPERCSVFTAGATGASALATIETTA